MAKAVYHATCRPDTKCTFRSRFSGSLCSVCGGEISKGELIGWQRFGGGKTPAPIIPIDAGGGAPSKPLTELNPAQALESAIKAIAGEAIDEAEVRKIVLDEVSKISASGVLSSTVTVKIADNAPVELEGRQHAVFADVLALAANRMNVLLIGPAGCGKTFLARQVAQALKLPFHSISCTAGMSETQLTGRLLPTGEAGRFEYSRTPFVEAYEDGGVFLLDELDGADPNVMLVINQALANGHLPVPNRISNSVAKRHGDFVAIAAANTFGTGANRLYVGRNQLDEATLDRFRIGQIEMDYDRDLELSVTPDKLLLNRLYAIRDKVAAVRLNRVGVSTRFIIDQASVMSAAGWSHDRIVKALVAGWTADERSKAGL